MDYDLVPPKEEIQSREIGSYDIDIYFLAGTNIGEKLNSTLETLIAENPTYRFNVVKRRNGVIRIEFERKKESTHV